MEAFVACDGEGQVNGVVFALVGWGLNNFPGLWGEFDFLISYGACDGVWAEVEPEDLAVAKALAVSVDGMNLYRCDGVLWIGSYEEVAVSHVSGDDGVWSTLGECVGLLDGLWGQVNFQFSWW